MHRETMNVGELLSISAARQIDRICDCYESVLRAGDEPNISRFLGELTGVQRQVLRAQLMLIDAEQAGATDTDAAASTLQAAVVASPLSAIGRFQVLEMIGKGGFGAVYRAYDPELERVVALKVPHANIVHQPEHFQRVSREARISAQFAHPHIVQVYEVFAHDGVPVIVSEFVWGMTLAERMSRQRFTIDEALGLAVTIARAVQFAHERGVIHRDIKPRNILIDHNGEPRITDFGLARRLGVDTTLTQAGQILGTPAYMAPEQFAGGAVGERADVYSLGVLLYELLAGRLPFDDELPILFARILEEPPAPLRVWDRTIPAELERIVAKCLEKTASGRYATVASLADDLCRFRSGQPTSVSSRHLGQKIGRMMRDTHHRPVLNDYGQIMMVDGMGCLVLNSAVLILQRHGVESRTAYACVGLAILSAWFIVRCKLRALRERPAFMEQAVSPSCFWGCAACLLVFAVEAILGLPVLTLAPMFAIVGGLSMLTLAHLFSGKFYVPALAYFFCAVAMAAWPAIGFACLAAVGFAAFFIPGYLYSSKYASLKPSRGAISSGALGAVADTY